MRDFKQSVSFTKGLSLLVIAGSALFWAWVDCFLFTPSFFRFSAASIQYFPIAFIVAVSSGCLVMICCIPRASRLRPLLFSARAPLWCAGLAAVAGTAVILGARHVIPPLIVAGSIANGLVFGAGVLFWGCIYAVQGGRSASILTPWSFTAAAFFCILFEALFNVPAMPFVVALLPAASFCLYSRAAKPSPSEQKQVLSQSAPPHSTEAAAAASVPENQMAASASSRSLFTRFGLAGGTIVGFAVFGIAFGLMQFNSVFAIESMDANASLQLLLARGIAATILALCAMALPGKLYIVYRIGMAIMIAGFMVMPFTMSHNTPTLLPGLIVTVGYTAFDVMCWTVLCETSFFRHRSAISLVGFGRTLVHGGIVLGVILGSLIPLTSLSATSSTIAITSVGYLLVVAVILLMGDNGGIWLLLQYGTLFERSGGAPQQASADSCGAPPDTQRATAEALVFAKVATRYGLTAREREVVELFGVGRSTAFIAQQLCISESTAKSHVRHIYAKCGIHNRQELLDLIESERF